MEVFEITSRADYVKTQIERSRSKFRYCKVAIADCLKYKRAILHDMQRLASNRPLGPIACLGTRSGREVDLFRISFFQPRLFAKLIEQGESRKFGIDSRFRFLDAIGRSDFTAIGTESAIGVEINPDGGRRDIRVGSFDEMPAEWKGRFRVLFSNSFDQSMNPYKTAEEWKRVLSPGGYLIFCFAEGQEPSRHDPVGRLSLEDVRAMFGGRLVFYQHRGSVAGYTEAILHIEAPG